MARLNTTFNPTEHDTQQRDFEEVPNGIYKLEIESSEVGPNSAGTGTVLKVVNRVIEPAEYEGRKIFGNFNIEHPNAKAQKIGAEQLASLCRAIGYAGELDDSEELHLRAFTAKVELGKASNGYKAKAEVKRYYFPDEGNVPEPAIAENQPAPAANDNKAGGEKKAGNTSGGGAKKDRPWG